MTFLAPWALAIAGLAAAAMVLLHLVARQRPAAYVLPTTRFIPDQRTLVSRAATRPRDLVLLALRVLLLLSVGAAFARPVLTPRRGEMARVVLLDHSRAVASAFEVVTRAKALASDGVPTTLIAFDSMPVVIATTALDSLAGAPRSRATGSLSAALIAARRASGALAERADSVQLVLVSPVTASEIDSATRRLRAEWPGAVRIERVAFLADSSGAWALERRLPAEDPLGPATAMLPSGSTVDTRLIRRPPTAADSTFARDGGTVVRWDSTTAARPTAEGLAVGDEVIVAALGRRAIPTSGKTIARWADGSAAATEAPLGKGCIRDVGVMMPAAGDIALHKPFQRLARTLLAPCGLLVAEHAADSSTLAWIGGPTTNAARADVLRSDDVRPSPLARWLLALAILLALAELAVRAKREPEVA
ncbi:MAG: BatA domain-containing protein [Gemmatimonadaceae bacterium]